MTNYFTSPSLSCVVHRMLGGEDKKKCPWRAIKWTTIKAKIRTIEGNL